MVCGTDADYKKENDKVAANQKKNDPEAQNKDAKKLLDDLIAGAPKAGNDAAAKELAIIAEIIASLSTLTIIKTETTTEGTLITFSNGTTSLQKSDGSTVITTTTYIIIININTTITVINNVTHTISTLNTDSSMTMINTALNTLSNISSKGDISSTTLVDGKTVNINVSSTG